MFSNHLSYFPATFRFRITKVVSKYTFFPCLLVCQKIKFPIFWKDSPTSEVTSTRPWRNAGSWLTEVSVVCFCPTGCSIDVYFFSRFDRHLLPPSLCSIRLSFPIVSSQLTSYLSALLSLYFPSLSLLPFSSHFCICISLLSSEPQVIWVTGLRKPTNHRLDQDIRGAWSPYVHMWMNMCVKYVCALVGVCVYNALVFVSTNI